MNEIAESNRSCSANNIDDADLADGLVDPIGNSPAIELFDAHISTIRRPVNRIRIPMRIFCQRFKDQSQLVAVLQGHRERGSRSRFIQDKTISPHWPLDANSRWIRRKSSSVTFFPASISDIRRSNSRPYSSSSFNSSSRRRCASACLSSEVRLGSFSSISAKLISTPCPKFPR